MEKVEEKGSITDTTLIKSLVKDGYHISDALFNTTLLDMQIMGLINVNWLTKDTRRIEIIVNKEEDDIELQNQKSLEKDYEDSFPEPNDSIN